MRQTIFAAMLLVLTPVTGIGEMTTDEAIKQRQATFKAMKGDVKKFKEAMQSKTSAGSAAMTEPAEQIVTHAKSLIGQFTAGSHKGKTRAKKKIWKKWADFEARQNALVTNAEQLLAASQTCSRKDLAMAFKTLAGDCKGCHRHYRQVF